MLTSEVIQLQLLSNSRSHCRQILQRGGTFVFLVRNEGGNCAMEQRY